MTGLEAGVLRLRLARDGFRVAQFHYHSVSAGLATVLDSFRDAVLAMPPPVHLVGHSLGGLMILRLLEREPGLPVGRTVLLGSPVRGSASARAVLRLPGAGVLFGALARAELTAAGARDWRHPSPLGVIAGSHALGMGMLFCDFDGPNDGAVAVEETRIDGAAAHLVLPVSHTGMLFSEAVAAQTASFLRDGRFDD